MSSERTPFGFGRFGGLSLDQPVDEVGADRAVDLLDVDWDLSVGSLRVREGVEKYNPAPLGGAPVNLFPHSRTILLGRRGKTLVAIQGGAEMASLAGAIEVRASYAHLGTPAASYTYIAQIGKPIKRFDGAAFAEPTATVNGEAGQAMPKPSLLLTWPDAENRLVAIGGSGNNGPGGAPTSQSHVWFGDPAGAPGHPEAFHTVDPEANYVQLGPGDGEEITDAVLWGGQLFVFKETRLYVFYGQSTDSEGAPEFNFRTIELGTRIRMPSQGGETGVAAVAAPDGVYFLGRDGLWFTTGGPPSRVSVGLDALASERLLTGPAAATFDLEPDGTALPTPIRWPAAFSIIYQRQRIYIPFRSARDPGLMLVFDLDSGEWLVWQARIEDIVSWSPVGQQNRLYFSSPASGVNLYLFTEDEDEDPLLTLEPRWQSGFYDLGNEDEKSLVEAKITGTGKVSFSSFKDLVGDPGFTDLVNLDQEGRSHGAQTGTLFSHKLGLEIGARVQRVTRYLRETRTATTKTGAK